MAPALANKRQVLFFARETLFQSCISSYACNNHKSLLSVCNLTELKLIATDTNKLHEKTQQQ